MFSFVCSEECVPCQCVLAFVPSGSNKEKSWIRLCSIPTSFYPFIFLISLIFFFDSQLYIKISKYLTAIFFNHICLIYTYFRLTPKSRLVVIVIVVVVVVVVVVIIVVVVVVK